MDYQIQVVTVPVTDVDQEFVVHADIRDRDGDTVARATVHWRLGPA